MPQVPIAIRRARAARLRAVADGRLDRFLAGFHGRRATALVETPRYGRTDHYAPIALGADCRPGTLVTARICGHTNGMLDGAVSQPAS
jgi:threonylcarbamoyladenosine tRNA methylthiotransferase MtaB